MPEADIGKCWNCKTRKGSLPCVRRCQLAVYCSRGCASRDINRHLVECDEAYWSRSCSTCGREKESLKRCSRCSSTLYCGKKCQQVHWDQSHKPQCNLITDSIMLAASARYQCEKLPLRRQSRYIGSSIAEDYLRLRQNEGSDTDRILKLLFAGAEDVRDVVQTIVQLPPEFRGQVQFDLHDDSIHATARNLLFFYCALAHPTEEDATHLVQIWYSVCLTPSSARFLELMLQQLTLQPRTSCLARMKSVVEVSKEDWKSCCDIWNGWIRLTKEKKSAERFLQERKAIMDGVKEYQKELIEVARQEEKASLEDFLAQGVLLPLSAEERTKAISVNPTMAYFNPFNPTYAFSYNEIDVVRGVQEGWGLAVDASKEMIYCVKGVCYVFACWDYLEVKKVNGIEGDLMAMYKNYLQGVFATAFKKMQETKFLVRLAIKDFGNLDDYSLQDTQFDRISVCNLSDSYYLPTLLEKFSPMLTESNCYSTMITKHEVSLGSALIQVNQRAMFGDPRMRADVLPDVAKFSQSNIWLNESSILTYGNCYTLLQTHLWAHVVANLYSSQQASLHKGAIKKAREMFHNFPLRMRNFRQELNRVIPFHREELVRRMSLIPLSKNIIEWVPK